MNCTIPSCLAARAREDTEKIDNDVKRKAERLHHVATVRVSISVRFRNVLDVSLVCVFVAAALFPQHPSSIKFSSSDFEKQSSIKIEKCR